MSDLKNKLSGILSSMFTSCERSTFLISKKQHETLSSSEKISLKIHLLTCKACRSFARQINYLSKGLDKLKKENAVFQLSKDEKYKIQQNFNDELKKQ
jgi:hypothetical protein